MLLNFNNSSFYISPFALFFLLTFSICFIRLHGNLGPLFIYRFMVTPIWALNIIFFISFITIFYFICDSSNSDNLVFLMIDKESNNINVGENATVNLNDGKVSLSVNHMGKVAAAISATGGATAGIQVAKYVAGPPAVKIAAGVATAGLVQVTTAVMNTVLNSEGKNGPTKLVANLVGENEYPLNLLVHMNTSVICGLIFLYIILNIYISKYIINKDIVKYLPVSLQNYKIVKFFVLWLDKYLNLWSKNSNYFLGFCYFMLSYSIILCKFILYIILLNKSVTFNYYPLDLLFYINGLIVCAITFLCIILNIYTSKYIINKDFIKYIPQNSKIGKFFALWLNKYLNLWSKNSNYLLGFCYFMLFFCITVCKLGLYLILYT